MAEPVVVTGLGIVSSIGMDVASFTRSLRAGRSGVEVVKDPEHGDERALLAPLVGFDLVTALDGLDGLDGPAALTPELRREVLRAGHRAPISIQAALSAATQAWLEAELPTRPVPGERIGIVVGGNNLTAAYAFDQYDTYLREPMYLPARYALQVKDTDHVGTLSQALGITGEGYTVGASSASGNAAVMHAARLISCGAVDVCLAVGAMSRLDPPERAALAKLGVLAEPEDDTPADGPRPFDRERSGFVPGEAVACLVLESRTGARRRGSQPLVELAGYAQALDGNSLSDPSAEGEARAMNTALEHAGVSGARVDYVNAHATATPAGDDAELTALRQVLGSGRPWINSTKALVGHTLSAAGAVEAVATVVQMRGGFVHPNPTLRHPVGDGHRLVGTTAVETSIDCALSNSFGFGGFNSCLVMLRA